MRRPAGVPAPLLLVIDRVPVLQPQFAAAVPSRPRLAQLPPPRPLSVLQILVGLAQRLVRRRELDLQPSQLFAQHEEPVGGVSR